MARRRRSRYAEPPMLEDGDVDGMMGGLDSLDEIITRQMAMDLGLAALAGGGSALLGSSVLGTDKLRSMSMFNSPNKRAWWALGGGLVGGWGLWRYNRDAAIGVASGLAGLGLATLVGNMMKVTVGLEGVGDGEDMYEEELSAAPSVTEDRMPMLLDQAEDESLLGLNAVVEEDEFADAVVETERLGSFLQ